MYTLYVQDLHTTYPWAGLSQAKAHDPYIKGISTLRIAVLDHSIFRSRRKLFRDLHYIAILVLHSPDPFIPLR